MPHVILYTKEGDPYSVRAKELLTKKHVAFEERHLPHYEKELFLKAKTTQTPQIFIDGVHIGSFAELGSLDLKGKLDQMLSVHERTHVDWHPDQPRS